MLKGIGSLDNSSFDSDAFFVDIFSCIRFSLQLVKRYCSVFLDYLLRKKVAKTAVETILFCIGPLHKKLVLCCFVSSYKKSMSNGSQPLSVDLCIRLGVSPERKALAHSLACKV